MEIISLWLILSILVTIIFKIDFWIFFIGIPLTIFILIITRNYILNCFDRAKKTSNLLCILGLHKYGKYKPVKFPPGSIGSIFRSDEERFCKICNYRDVKNIDSTIMKYKLQESKRIMDSWE